MKLESSRRPHSKVYCMCARQRCHCTSCSSSGDSESDVIFEEQLFEPYVAAGRFIKRVQHGIRIKDLGPEHRRVFYSQPGEEWRIDAYILMKKVAERSGWGEALERMEGSLLGYEDWQNDVFIKTLYRPKGGG